MVAEVVVEKTKRFRDNPTFDLASLRVLSAVGITHHENTLNVLDFGGAAGAHYFTARHFYGDINLLWQVVETPAMVSRAKELEDSSLKFSEEIGGKYDLVFASGSLQYTPDPLQTLERLVHTNAEYLCVTRTVLSEGPTRITVQEAKISDNGIGRMPEGFTDARVKFPLTFASRSLFEKIITSRYKIIGQFKEELMMFGYFCRRKEAA